MQVIDLTRDSRRPKRMAYLGFPQEEGLVDLSSEHNTPAYLRTEQHNGSPDVEIYRLGDELIKVPEGHVIDTLSGRVVKRIDEEGVLIDLRGKDELDSLSLGTGDYFGLGDDCSKLIPIRVETPRIKPPVQPVDIRVQL